MLCEPALRHKGTARGALTLGFRPVLRAPIAARQLSHPIPQTPFPGCRGLRGRGLGTRDTFTAREGVDPCAPRGVTPPSHGTTRSGSS